MILLFAAAVLAEWILILDLLFRIYERKEERRKEWERREGGSGKGKRGRDLVVAELRENVMEG